MIDISYKNVKPSHLTKLKIIQNINNQCSKSSSQFLIDFDNANHSFFHPLSSVDGNKFSKKMLPGGGG